MNKLIKNRKGIKRSISQNVKQAFRKDQFLSFIINGRLAYVFCPNMKNKLKNEVIHELSHIFHEFNEKSDVEVQVYFLPSSDYPTQFKTQALDVVHNVLISVEDQSQLEHEGIEKEHVCGKSIPKAYEWYQHLFGEIDTHTYKKCLRKLVRRNLVVPTTVGTVWYKPYFDEMEENYEFTVSYEDFVKKV